MNTKNLFNSILRESDYQPAEVAFEEARYFFNITEDYEELHDEVMAGFADDPAQYGDDRRGIDPVADGWITLMSFAFDEYLGVKTNNSYRKLVNLYKRRGVFTDAIDAMCRDF